MENDNQRLELEVDALNETRSENERILKENKELKTEHQRLELEIVEVNQKTVEFNNLSVQIKDFSKERDLLEKRILCANLRWEKSKEDAEKFKRQAEELRVKVTEKNLESKYNINEKLAEANMCLNGQIKELKTALKEAAKKQKLEAVQFAMKLEEQEMNCRTLQYLNDELENKYENSKRLIESNKEVSKELRKLTNKRVGSTQDNLLTAFKCIALIRQKEEQTSNIEKPKDSTVVKLNDDQILESNLELNQQVKDLMQTTLKQKVEEKQQVARIDELQMNIRTLQYLNEELERKYENYKKIVEATKDLSREMKKLISKKGGSHDDFIATITELQKQNEEFKKSLLERFEDEDLISEIKKFLNTSQLEFLRNPNSQIIEWKGEDVAEAVDLHACSPEAYNFLKNKGFPLPAESVLQTWTDQQVISNSLDNKACQEEHFEQAPKKIKLEPDPCSSDTEKASREENYEQSPKKIKLEPDPCSSDQLLKESELKVEIKQEIEDVDVDVESPFIQESLVYTQEIKQEVEVHFVLKGKVFTDLINLFHVKNSYCFFLEEIP